ncbi:unnamed protein product [Schistosoma rodhaini]|uniref:Uncharacterized protein n=1 Tax=Schistosoma rodhaini TaxID=6188 RepID=A0AA85F8A8_9TREM|nr:unnamed protein product [Schistosoma rodhaini]
METEYYSFLCYDGVERTFKCQSTQTLEEDMVMHFEVDSDIVAVTSEGTEDIDIMGDEYTESREEDGSLDFDNMRKSVSFRKTPVELIVPAKYVDDEYGVESAPESSSDKEEYPTREEYTNREWINKPISNWINDTYVNIPNILDQVDSFKNVKDEQNVDNNFNFPYILQIYKHLTGRNIFIRIILKILQKKTLKTIKHTI